MKAALVIAQDARRGRDLALRMRERGFRPALARDASGGIAEARLRQPDVVLIDPTVDEPSGASTARIISGIAPRARLFVVADDPRQPRRMRAVPVAAPADPVPPPAPRAPALRSIDGTVAIGDLLIDRTTGSVTLAGRDADLTTLEYRLLGVLADAYGTVLSRDQIHQSVWGGSLRPGSRSVDVLVRRLRRKVDEAGGAFTFVQTVTGQGYRLQAVPRALSA